MIGKQQEKNRSNRDSSELQLLCRYNSGKAVANNGEGWKSSQKVSLGSTLHVKRAIRQLLKGTLAAALPLSRKM